MTGYLKDTFTDDIDIKIEQCSKELDITFWSEETEERQKNGTLPKIKSQTINTQNDKENYFTYIHFNCL